jgi:hypothetical protein
MLRRETRVPLPLVLFLSWQVDADSGAIYGGSEMGIGPCPEV